MNITTAGIDLAKNTFSVHGVDAQGKVVLKKTVTRGKLLETFANLPPCRVAMEACSGAHHWARRLSAMGHHISPSKGRKNQYDYPVFAQRLIAHHG